LRDTLKDLCHTKCLTKFKDDEICAEFCRFTKHIEEDHGAEILKLYEQMNTEDKGAILDYSMDDVVRWRFQSMIEDDHLMGATFMKSVVKWMMYKRRDEL